MEVSKALFQNETLTAELCVWLSIESLWFRGQEHAWAHAVIAGYTPSLGLGFFLLV
jgi:hypothetical protein